MGVIVTQEQLDRHIGLVQALADAQETYRNLLGKAHPGAQNLDGMPHGSGTSDKTGELGAELGDLETRIHRLDESVRRSEETIEAWLHSIPDTYAKAATMFRLRYLRGKPWKTVAEFVSPYMSAANAQRICTNYLRREQEAIAES